MGVRKLIDELRFEGSVYRVPERAATLLGILDILCGGLARGLCSQAGADFRGE